MEDVLYEIASMRLFASWSLDKAIPDHTTILKFRHLLERHDLARQVFKEVNQWLSEADVLLKEGSLVSATVIEAPVIPPIYRAASGALPQRPGHYVEAGPSLVLGWL